MPCLHTLSRPPARTSAPEVASRPRRSEDEALGELYQQVSSRSGLAPPPEAFDALAAYPSRPLWPCAAACGPPLGFPFPLGLSSACTPSGLQLLRSLATFESVHHQSAASPLAPSSGAHVHAHSIAPRSDPGRPAGLMIATLSRLITHGRLCGPCIISVLSARAGRLPQTRATAPARRQRRRESRRRCPASPSESVR